MSTFTNSSLLICTFGKKGCNTNDGVGAQITTLAFNMPESGTNSAYTGFQFAASSGNIKGRITVYGIKNPA